MRPLERLGVPVGEARAVVGLALRFVPLLAEETGRIARLQALRAGRPPRGTRERLTRLRARVVPSLVGALERAEQVALALEARHHRGAPGRANSWPRAATLAGIAMFAAVLLWRN
jgi:energy-coupling factor transport system permease protein